MTGLTQDTCVVVADGEKALFLRNLTDAENPNLDVTAKEAQDNPTDISQSANRPGRGHDPGPNQRSAFDDTDWHELAKDRFAADLADELHAQVHAGRIGRLVLVASPRRVAPPPSQGGRRTGGRRGRQDADQPPHPPDEALVLAKLGQVG